MPHHLLRSGSANSFLAHRLDGWDPLHATVRFPVTFAIYREGDNNGLYLAPAGMVGLRDALGLPGDDQALVLDSRDGPGVLRWQDIDILEGEAEVVHLPRGADAWKAERDLPTPLLAHPDSAVPSHRGSQAAISLHDGCHGTLITPDPALLAACLRGFIDDYQVAVLSRDAELPAISDELLEPLLEPLGEDRWWGLHLEAGRRYWLMNLVLHDDEGPCDALRWVSEGERGRWRTGWSW